MLNVKIVSRETIKPSSPTPENLRHLQLSLLDQLILPAHFPFVLFYSDNKTAGKSSRLKKSLSEVLTRFYPLAGRIKMDDASGYINVDCNDEGVEFQETQVEGLLSDFLRQPPIEESKRLLPSVVSTDVPLAVQLNVFDCGGIAIGVFLLHVIGDGNSMVMLIKSWANATSGDLDKIAAPVFGFASLFPPRIMKRQMKELPTIEEKVVVKRFVFEAAKIKLLREAIYTRSSTWISPEGLFPKRVEAVSTLIWRCSMRARGEEGLQRKPIAMFAVNIRGRIEPPLSENTFGNLWIPAFVTGTRVVDDCSSDRVGFLEMRSRETIGNIKGDGIRHVLESNEDMSIHDSSWNLFAHEWEKQGFTFFMISSWCSFPVYELDFGWGKPEWLSFVSVAVKNSVTLVPMRHGEGMEAWVFMVEREMTRFEQDSELLAYVSVVN